MISLIAPNLPAGFSATPENELNNILLFRTNIRTDADFLAVQQHFDTHPHISEWTIDREDVDCVLRIFSAQLTTGDIIRLAGQLGFECSELD